MVKKLALSHYLCYRRRVIILSFIIALLLQLIPWPDQFYICKPSWLLLILIYWVLTLPYYINIGTGFLIGCTIDLIIGSKHLGISALAMSIIAYLVAFKFHLIIHCSLWQQSIIVVVLSLIMEVIIFLGEYVFMNISFKYEILCSSFINGILWPWLFLLMSKINDQFVSE